MRFIVVYYFAVQFKNENKYGIRLRFLMGSG